MHLLAGTLPLTVAEHGSGARSYLLLHGGAGPASMHGLAERLDGNVIVPTHPGFMGTDRPRWLTRPGELVLAYLALLDALAAKDVVVVGNSFGGWLAAEIGLRRSPRVASIVLLNAVGIAPGDRPIVDPTKLSPPERAAHAFHDPRRAIALATPEALAQMPGNQAALNLYAGGPAFMHDPTLEGRLADLAVPALVMWGESDRIVDAAYGERFAKAMGARFELVAEAGHFPQIEQLDRVAARIGEL